MTAATSALDIRVKGEVSSDERDCADATISAVLHKTATDRVRVRISAANCANGPGLVQINLRVHGAAARVQVSGRTVVLAISAAAARLRRQINRLTTAWDPWPWPDPERPVLAVPGDRPVARLKTVRLHIGMPCQAVAFLNAMDYDVFLYTDGETGEDAIIYRAGPTGLCLARQRTMRPPTMPSLLPLTMNTRKIPILTPGQAAAKLAEQWLPYVFYTDHASRRGNLLYRRYDGDLGLISPTILDTVP
jgi:hypothetical protein